jgi:NTE family protein
MAQTSSLEVAKGIISAMKKSKTALILQGGGALGAYQAGVYSGLDKHGLEPDWVVGTSIGAINAAIIAGNPKAKRIEKLEGFWATVSTDSSLSSAFPFLGMTDWFKPWAAGSRNFNTLINGVPGFFSPRANGLWDLDQTVPTSAASFYDTAPLEATLNEFVDFNYLNQRHTHLTVSAVNVATAELTLFENKPGHEITAKHIMASGALPPGFAPVEINHQFYWDGGIYSNTPLDIVLDREQSGDLLCFMVDLWDPTESLPTSIAMAMTRLKDVQFASRSEERIEDHKKLLQLKHAMQSLAEHIPQSKRDTPQIKKLMANTLAPKVNIVRLIMKALPDDDQLKDIDFSQETISLRWQAGQMDTDRMMKHKAWLAPLAADISLAVHELQQL